MAQEQRTFAADKIRTTEICGLDGKPVTICNLISGYTISGEGLTVSGDGHSLVTAESGIFENLTIGGGIITGGVIVSGSPLISAESGIFDHLEVGGGAITGGVMISGSPLVAAESGRFDHLTIDGIEIAATLVTRSAYAFKFGGPPVRVPERLPLTTGSFEGFTGLAAGQKYVFVEETGSFETGDHITINLGGLSGDGLPQESHTISGIDYYRPTDCCNAQTFSIGSVGGNYLEHYNEDNNGYNFQVGDTIKIDGSDTIYTVTVSNISSSSVRYIYFNPLLPVGAAAGSCICLVQPTLATESNLINDYPTGTYVSNKHPKTTTVLAETSGDFYWDNTVLLIQSNDLNNSASFIDSSQSAHLITSTGDIHHEADEFKFGISSIHLDGDGDYLSGAADNDWDFETNDFTIEFWMNSTYTEKRMHALSFGETGTTTPTNNIEFNFNDQTTTAYDNTGLMAFWNGGGDNHVSTDIDYCDGNWHHIALVRNENTWTLYGDGKSVSSTIYTSPVDSSSHSMFIGKSAHGNHSSYVGSPHYGPWYFSGYLGDVRITKAARYTDDFDAPAKAFDAFLRQASACDSTCYNNQYLYVERGSYTGDFDWPLSDYREYFIDVSGVDVNITGDNTNGLLTLMYPDQRI